MPPIDPALYAFNAGVVSDKALARVDLAKMRLAAETQENIIPMVLGPAQFRQGTKYIDRTYNDTACRFIPFVYNTSNKALIIVNASGIQVMVDDVIVTRPAVTAAVTNGNFDANVASWTDNDEAGAVSQWRTGGYLELIGTGANRAIRDQQVVVTETGTEHALRIVIERGPVTLTVGTNTGLDDYIAETALRTGTHSIAFTPSGNFWIRLQSDSVAPRLVDSINVEAAGEMLLPTPWGSDYMLLKYEQSGDIVFVARANVQQRRIERRAQRSWSITKYAARNGPFRPINIDQVTITPSATTGSVTLTASRATFKSSHTNALFRLTHPSQTVTVAAAGTTQFSNYIRVVGVGSAGGSNNRQFTVTITGTWTATVVLQQSIGSPGSWTTVKSWTANTTETYADSLTNQIVYYRIGIDSLYTSGTANCTLFYGNAVQIGIARVTDYTSSTVVTADVLEEFGSTAATLEWEEGEWSDYRGWPAALTFHDGRMWWGWLDRVYGSVTDDYENYDDREEGDSAPVMRSITTGGFEGILWLASVQRLLAGTAAQGISIRASAFDGPITPTDFTARAFTVQGAADIQPAELGSRAVIVQRSAKRVYEASISPDQIDYETRDLTRLAVDLLSSGIVSMAVQNQPDTRLWFVMANGTAACLVYEPADEVVAWITVATASGDLFKEVGVLPGSNEDLVYFAVQRTNSGGTIMAIERLMETSDAEGGTLTKCMDSHVVYQGAPATVIGGGAHLAGRTVVAWGDGAPLSGTYVVNGSGQITLGSAKSNVAFGLAYSGKFKSTKLAYGGGLGSALGKKKRVDHVGLVMTDVSWSGVRVGRDFSNMTGLTATKDSGAALAANTVQATYDYQGAAFNGGWDTDARICFQVDSPHCGTFLGAALSMTTNERRSPGDASQDENADGR